MIQTIFKLPALALRNTLFRATILLALANAVANVFNYLFQLSMAQLLTPEEFGTLASLLALFVILSVLAPALQLATARFAARIDPNQRRALWIYLLKRSLTLGVIGASLALVLSPALMWLLHIPSIKLWVVLSFSFFFALALPVNIGMLQGLQRFGWVSFANLGTPLLRLIWGVIFVLVGLGTLGALSSLMVSGLLIFVGTSIPLVRLNRGELVTKMASLVQHFSWTAIAFGAFVVLVNADVVLAKHYLTPESAGEYAAVAILGRVVLFAPVGVTLMIVPAVAGVNQSQHRRLVILGLSVAYTIVAAGIVVSIYGMFPSLVVRLLVGNEYAAITPVIFRYSIGTFGMAIVFILMHYYLSTNRIGVAIPLVAAVFLQIGLILVFHSGVGQLVDVRLVSGLAALLVVAVFGLARSFKPLKRL